MDLEGRGHAFECLGAEIVTGEYPWISRCVTALMTTVSGAANPWRRAAIFGVSPNPSCSCRPPLGLDKLCRTEYGRAMRGDTDGAARGKLGGAGWHNRLPSRVGVDRSRDTPLYEQED